MKNKITLDLNNLGVKEIKENEPLYRHTTYRVGGPALVYIDAVDLNDVVTTVNYAIKNNIKYFVLGYGSNVLISDKILQGIVISTRRLNSFEVNKNSVIAQCGVSLIALAYKTANLGLSGLEFSSGIPGCIGGAVFMNAGAYKHDMSTVVKKVLLLRGGKQEWVPIEELEFAYRKSILQSRRDWVVLAVEMELNNADPDKILKLIKERKNRREDAQPYNAYCAGSVFKNPSATVSSWQLVDDVNLRGYAINDAQVSLKHSNFIVNNDRASAQDVYDLIMLVRDVVYKEKKVLLNVEIELVNFDE